MSDTEQESNDHVTFGEYKVSRDVVYQIRRLQAALNGYRQVLDEKNDEIERLRKSLLTAMREGLAWRDHAEDYHDQNYGHCCKGCTKCELKRKAWQIAAATDANPICREYAERVRKERKQ